jgi:hypothetical protein
MAANLGISPGNRAHTQTTVPDQVKKHQQNRATETRYQAAAGVESYGVDRGKTGGATATNHWADDARRAGEGGDSER